MIKYYVYTSIGRRNSFKIINAIKALIIQKAALKADPNFLIIGNTHGNDP
jgi:hypothetical protein